MPSAKTNARKMKNVNLDKAWTQDVESLVDQLQVSREEGLSSSEIPQRRKRYGRNVFRQRKRRGTLSILIDQFKSFVIALLGAAAIVSLLLGQTVEAIAVFAAIFINTVIGFVTELKAVRSMDALRKLSRVQANVRRNGKVEKISAADLVVGDLVPLEAGDIIPADLRVIEANKLQLNESALTGESEPVTKNPESTPEDTPLAERTGMMYKGTSITRGSGAGIVVAVGKATELGQIQEMVEEATDETTPLEKRLNRLAHRLIWVTLGLTAVVALVGMLGGKDIAIMIKSAVALAVAAIPEGLPIVATVALARGMSHMAERNALVNRLASVETLGATNIIGADKTGTLTENRMTVRKLLLGAAHRPVDFGESRAGPAQTGEGDTAEADPLLLEALQIGVLCNNASLSESGDDDGSGDPMEIALLRAGRQVGLKRQDLLDTLPEEREEAFDPETMMMATVHARDDGYLVAVKGAPDAILENCERIRTQEGDQGLSDADREKWRGINEELASDGLRVIGLATKELSDKDADPYDGLTLIGLVGLMDPARNDVPSAIAECREAGIRVVMMTGDQPGTARKIAADIGLTNDADDHFMLGSDWTDNEEIDDDLREEIRSATIFARVTPRQKLTIIDTHREAGNVVAMTGDGVNDAPALKKADIGIAMGKRGTQVAKEAAEMILQDDAFPTIVAAVRQGRIIFENIRKFVVYLLSGNVSEIIAVAVASLFRAPLPLLPLQILFLNLVLDVFPALALGVGRGDRNVMKQPPRRPDESVLTRYHWSAISIYGILIATMILLSLTLAIHWLDMTPESAVTVSFLTLSFARMWHVFNMRDNKSSLIRNEITRNGYVWAALGLCFLLIIGATQIPVLARILSLHSPGAEGWTIAFLASLVPLAVGQLLKKTGVIKI